MSYSDFVDSLSYGVDLFVNNISNVFESMIHNYFFITLLGCALFVSLVLWLFNLLLDLIYKRRDDLDQYLEMKKRYNWSQAIAMDYYFLNKFKIRQLKADKYRMQQLIKYDYLRKYQFDESIYNYRKLILNKVVSSHFLKYRGDLENSILHQRLHNAYDSKFKFQDIHKDIAIRNRVQDMQLHKAASVIFSKNERLAEKKRKKGKKGNEEPSWFNENLEKITPSDDEKNEMQNIINNF